jgi:hypothetical protein
MAAGGAWQQQEGTWQQTWLSVKDAHRRVGFAFRAVLQECEELASLHNLQKHVQTVPILKKCQTRVTQRDIEQLNKPRAVDSSYDQQQHQACTHTRPAPMIRSNIKHAHTRDQLL